MANLKISQLNSGNPAQSGDVLPMERAGVNFSLTAGSIAALAATSAVKTARLNIGSLVTAGFSGPHALTFATPFADGNYTVQVSVTCGEAPETATVAAFPSVGVACINYQSTPGNGVNVWVANNDSGTHTNVTIQVTAVHD